MKQVISIKNILNSVALCSVLFFVISISASRASASTIVNLNPTDDTKVNKSSPATNYGKSTSVEVDGGGTYEEIYMKFDLASLAEKNIVSAKLKVKVNNTSTSQQNYKLVNDTSWLETGINYNNRPAKASSAFATAMGGPSGSTQIIDMTSTVKSKLGQKFAFNIDMTVSDGFGFKSKETSTTSDRPVLIVEYNDTTATATPTKTATATPTKTPTPKPSVTIAPTKTPTPIVQPTVITTTPGAVDSISLSPIADTYVQSDTPSTNYGTKTSLYSVGSPAKITYFKFDLSTTAGRPIKSAVLYTKVQNDSTDVQTVSNVEDNAWIETAMNFNNKPALGSVIGTFTAGAINSMNASDITSAVSAHTGGLMTIAFSSTKTNNMAVYSRESADKPILKILFSPPVTLIPYITVAPTPLPTSEWHSIKWTTNTVSLSADNFYIIAGGKKFVPPASAKLHSDPGNPSYTSLEIEWTENGIPMWFYMYFSADTDKWKVYEMRTYDGTPAGNWVYYKQDNYFSAPIGANTGTIDMDITSGSNDNRIHFTHTILSTTLKGTNMSPTVTPCPAKSKGDANCDGNVDFIDFEIWRNEFMGEDTKTVANFNYTEDQKVDFIDFEIWRQGYMGISNMPVCVTPDACPLPPQDCHYEQQSTCSCGLIVCPPTLTPTITPPCQWCGTSCTTYTPGVACPALAPPEGYSCKQVAGQCTATAP